MRLGPEAATRRLVDLANERGGRDNITSIAVELLPDAG
jgi:serine/threonine protein phosphatase PrpC